MEAQRRVPGARPPTGGFQGFASHGALRPGGRRCGKQQCQAGEPSFHGRHVTTGGRGRGAELWPGPKPDQQQRGRQRRRVRLRQSASDALADPVASAVTLEPISVVAPGVGRLRARDTASDLLVVCSVRPISFWSAGATRQWAGHHDPGEGRSKGTGMGVGSGKGGGKRGGRRQWRQREYLPPFLRQPMAAPGFLDRPGLPPGRS